MLPDLGEIYPKFKIFVEYLLSYQIIFLLNISPLGKFLHFQIAKCIQLIINSMSAIMMCKLQNSAWGERDRTKVTRLSDICCISFEFVAKLGIHNLIEVLQ